MPAIINHPTIKDHTVLFKELVDWVVERKIPSDFAFDSYFTNAASLNHIQRTEQGKHRKKMIRRRQYERGRESIVCGDKNLAVMSVALSHT